MSEWALARIATIRRKLKQNEGACYSEEMFLFDKDMVWALAEIERLYAMQAGRILDE